MSEAAVPRELEKIKYEIKALALSLAIAAESGEKGAAATYIAANIAVISDLFLIVEPDWPSDTTYAPFGAAVDYYRALAPAAAGLTASLQQSNSHPAAG